jgi:PadR family transcriptional regulator, regulatory protein PadR
MSEVRLTGSVIKVLAALITAGTDGAYGHELARDFRVSKTTIYGVLARVENAKWATSEWESIDPVEEKRPRRRLYRLTPEGQEIACKVVEAERRAFFGVPIAASGCRVPETNAHDPIRHRPERGCSAVRGVRIAWAGTGSERPHQG